MMVSVSYMCGCNSLFLVPLALILFLFQNNLRTGFVVQLYLKVHGMYLGIDKRGEVYSTPSADDPLSKWI